MLPQEEEVLAPPLVKQSEVEYDTIDVEISDIEKKVSGAGTFVSILEETLFFQARGGRLKAIHVKNGQEIKEGDLIAEIYNEGLENDIKQQELNVQKAQIRYDQINNTEKNLDSLRLAEIDLEVAKARLAELELMGEFSSKAEIEQQKLVVEKAQIAYNQVKSNTETDSDALKLVEIDLEMEQLRLAELRQQFEDSRLVAKTAGTVIYINSAIKQGEYVDTYVPLVTIADPKQVQLLYTGSYHDEFKLGMTVDVKINDQIYEGIVAMTPDSVPKDADESLKRSVLIDVKNLPEDVVMGDSVPISLSLAKKENVIVIQRSLVQNYLGRTFVNVLVDGIKEERDVEVGLETPTQVEIVEGLKEGDKVIVR